MRLWQKWLVVVSLWFGVMGGVLAQSLPSDVKWETNEKDPEYADPNAKRGGTFRDYLLGFPLTLRLFGPDGNGVFGNYMNAIYWAPVAVHPNTGNLIPALATHWAYGSDQKTMYFRLNKEATWSDGKPVTADDFVYALDFLRSPKIIDPWSNDFYTKEVASITKYDDHTFSVTSTIVRPQSDLYIYVSLPAIPKHFYGTLDDNYVTTFNWKAPPTPGPYVIAEVNKGKNVVFKRLKTWWGDNLRFYRHRYNVDRINFEVIRDQNVAWEHFKRGDLDNFPVTQPLLWHEKAVGPEFQKGYIEKLWFYTEMPQSATGIWLNNDIEPLNDQNVRLGISHAMNVDKVIKQVLRGDYERLAQHYQGYGAYTDKTIKARSFDLKKAGEYFDKAGWKERGSDGIRMKNGKRLSLTLTYTADLLTPRLVVLKEEAKKAGFEMNLQLLDDSGGFKYFREKKHQMCYMNWTTGERPAYHEMYHSENAHKPQTNNLSNTADPKLDALIDQYRQSTNEKELIALSHKIQRMIHENGSFIPTFSVPYFRDAYWRWLKGPKPIATKFTPGTAFLPLDVPSGRSSGGLFWIDEEAKKETLAAQKSGKAFKEVVVTDKTFHGNH